MTKRERPRATYRRAISALRLCAPILKAFYYLFIAAVLLCGILALIVLFVNVPVEEMLLPPFMTVQKNESYSIFIGNGIRIDAAYDAVQLNDIKTVIYAELLLFAAVSCLLAPVSLFLSRLIQNIATGAVYEEKNARYMIYIAMSVAIGYTFVQVAGRFYNYLLVKTFVANSEAIHLSLGWDPAGVLFGLLILLFASLYGHACEVHSRSATERKEISAREL